MIKPILSSQPLPLSPAGATHKPPIQPPRTSRQRPRARVNDADELAAHSNNPYWVLRQDDAPSERRVKPPPSQSLESDRSTSRRPQAPAPPAQLESISLAKPDSADAGTACQTPFMRRDVRMPHLPRRSLPLCGTLLRRIDGDHGKPISRAVVRPDGSFPRDIVIEPAEAAEGIVSGARVSLTAAPGNSSGVQLQFHGGDRAAGMAAIVTRDGARIVARPLARGGCSPYPEVQLDAREAEDLVDKAVMISITQPDGPAASPRGKVEEVLGNPDEPSAVFVRNAVEEGAEVGFPPDVWEQVRAIERNPGIDDPSLVDLTGLAFITIDNDYSRDLDQAMCITRRQDGGFDVHYAIANTAHYVRPGSALDRVASRRCLTTYLPGRDLPLMPRELSAGLCSLAPNEDRRAVVATVSLDADGRKTGSVFRLARIHSRAQLSYNGVQRFFDSQRTGDCAGRDFTETLELLRSVGEKRIALAEKKGVVPFPEGEDDIAQEDGRPGRFLLRRNTRNQVELWNEQISVLVNCAVGEYLHDRGLRTIHRHHPAPDATKLEALRRQLRDLNAPSWRRGERIGDYVRRLDLSDPLHCAAQLLVCRSNERASYSTEDSGHDGLKAPRYVHFTAPMRRKPDQEVQQILVDSIKGKAAADIAHQCGGQREPAGKDELERVATETNRACERETRIERKNLLFEQAIEMAQHCGEPLPGRIDYVAPTGFSAHLDDHPVSLWVPVRALNAACQDSGYHAISQGSVELSGPTGRYRMGDARTMAVVAADPAQGRIDALPFHLAPNRHTMAPPG